MAVAIDRRGAYFATEQISSNVDISPEGYLICRNVVIGRTGFQRYKVSEVDDPDGLLADANLHQDDDVDLWRDPSEVFSDQTIASFEGKTFTLTHPDQLLNPDTEREHFVGHLQNVRPGKEPLPDGNFPLLGDVVIKVREAIDAFHDGMREVSCGYWYTLGRTGYRWDQKQIIGNHLALVPTGRAGNARIQDAAPKEKPPVNIFKHILGLGVKEYAKDAKPEDLAEALQNAEVRAVATDAAPARIATNTITTTETLDAKLGKLVVVGTAIDGAKLYKMAVGKDEEAEPAAKAKDENGETTVDRRKRMHDVLDKMVDASEKNEAQMAAETDADVKAMSDMVTKFTGAKDADPEEEKTEKAEDAHPEDCRCTDCMDKRKAKDAEEEKTEEGEDAEIVRAEPVLAAGETPRNAFDADMTMDMLKQLRKVVAKSKDELVKKAFDSFYRGMDAARKQASGQGSYRVFSQAAGKVSDEAVKTAKDAKPPALTPAEQEIKANDDIYAKAGEALRAKSRGTAR